MQTNYGYNGFTIPTGQWQDSPDPNAGWRDPHRSGIAALGRILDPVSYIPGLKVIPEAVDKYVTQPVTDTANRVLSPIVGAVQAVEHKINPISNYLDKNVGIIQGINQFARDKPADTLGILAASFFGGGALAGAASSAAAPAASGAAGASGGATSAGAAGSAAITPAFQSGALAAETAAGAGSAGSLTGSLAGASSITPSSLAFASPGIAGAAPSGTLGLAGTQAAMSALTPALSSIPGASSGGTLASLYGRANPYIKSIKNLNNFAKQDNKDNASDNSGFGFTTDEVRPIDVKPVRPLNIQRISNKLAGIR